MKHVNLVGCSQESSPGLWIAGPLHDHDPQSFPCSFNNNYTGALHVNSYYVRNYTAFQTGKKIKAGNSNLYLHFSKPIKRNVAEFF